MKVSSVCKANGGDYKHGYINTAGQEVIPLMYDAAAPFSGGLAMVRKERAYGRRGPVRWRNFRCHHRAEG
mgnify:CR=1 FL=1